MKKISNIASISAFALLAMAPQIAYSQAIDPDVQAAIDNAVESEANDRQDADEALDGRIDPLETTVNDPFTGVGALNDRADALEDTVNDATTGVGALNDRADALEDTVNDATTGVGALNDRADALEVRAGENEVRTGELEGRAGALEGRAGALEGRAGALEAVNSAQDTRMDSIDTTVDALGNSAANALGGGASYVDGVFTPPSYTIQGTAHNNVGDALGAINTTLNQHGTRLDNLDTKVIQLENQQELYNRQANGGIAAAMALGGAMIVPDSTVSVNFNIATYRGEQGFAGNLTVRASERVYFNGGVVGSTVRGSTGGRVGVAFGF